MKKGNLGFTLVELIIVIAILAILSTGAIAGYSAYIEKAKEAVDSQLLSTVNTAFAMTCINENIDYFNRTDVKIELEGEDGAKTIKNITVGAVSDFFTKFCTYYEGGTFQSYTSLYYDGKVGGFVSGTNNAFSQIFSALDLSAYVAKVNGSTFGTIGAQGLMERVDVVTGLASALMEDGTSNFATTLRQALLGDASGLTSALGFNSTGELEDYMKNLSQAEISKIIANYAVLQVANTTSEKTNEQVLEDLRGGIGIDEIKGLMGQSSDASAQEDGVSKAALLYAMYTSYANSLPDTDQNKTTAMDNLKDMNAFVGAINNETTEDSGFNDYLKSDQASTDLDGFMAAMNIISESTANNPEATKNLLENGYTDPELVAALTALLG